MLAISSRCEPLYAAMGMAGFDYASIKDSIRDFGLKVKDHRREISMIGRYFAMSDDNFESLGNSTDLNDITAEDINAAVNRSANV